MKIEIRVKCRGPKIHFALKKRSESKDNVREQNVGREVFEAVKALFAEFCARGGGTWRGEEEG